ncbi:MAG: hypothetical protein D3914_05030 [Candidatus Electrothrix sp. LOE2]|nr:hypothetical protein [Candidatus Electrothrix sp. LOE2]
MVTEDFFSLISYSLFTAASEINPSEIDRFMWRNGQILAEEICSKIEFVEKTPIEVCNKIGAYLVQAGYLKRASFELLDDSRIRVEISSAIRQAVLRLSAQGKQCPHYLTAITFAALEEITGKKVTLDSLDLATDSEGVTVEIWKLSDLVG